jgi:hypothetical protein
MMRQYELVERVRRYNPHANEDLLNRAYVFAMKAHGSQKRASGDPYFSHSARSRRDRTHDVCRIDHAAPHADEGDRAGSVRPGGVGGGLAFLQ